jgi:uncharacterized protein (TIGR02145 family)
MIPDTLVYSWNGKTFLRDTLHSLDQSKIDRRFDTTNNPLLTYGYFRDDRDSTVYRMIRIGNQTWMAENLKFYKIGSNTSCYNSNDSLCLIYGRLYDWISATTSCPAGWHLPTTDEFSILASEAGGTYSAGPSLKSISGWTKTNGLDKLGFSALPAGNRLESFYSKLGELGYWWSATPLDSTRSWYRVINSVNNEFPVTNSTRAARLSVRCVRN